MNIFGKVPPIIGNEKSARVTTVINGVSYTLHADDRRFKALFDVLREHGSDDNVADLMLDVINQNVENEIEKVSNGALSFNDGKVFYEGKELHSLVVDKIKELWNDGLPFDGLFAFLEKLMKNPDSQCVERLYLYLEKNGMPIINEGEYKGCFISYKNVQQNYQSWHTGKDGEKVFSRPGTIVKMRRNLVDSKHENGCSQGLHCGSLDYASNFHGSAGRLILTIVDPENVVTVPYEDCEKLRCCEYYVIGDYLESAPLSGSVYTDKGERVPPTTVFVEAEWECLEDEFADAVTTNTNAVQNFGNDNWKTQRRDKFGRFTR